MIDDFVEMERRHQRTQSLYWLIDQIAERHGNASPYLREEAIFADKSNRPAFWTFSGAENTRAHLLAYRANHTFLSQALVHNQGGDIIAALDDLIPLNQDAIDVLHRSYEMIRETHGKYTREDLWKRASQEKGQ